MKNPLIVIVACALVLAGAYFTSQMLVSDVPAPAVTTPTTLVPASPEPSPSPPSPALEAAQAAMLGPRQGLQHVDPGPSAPAYAVEAAPTAVVPADLAASPFQGDSKELDYAEALLAEPNPGLERLQSAHQVLDRCVQQEPNNQRCLDALAKAQSRLGAKAAVERQPELPTLRVEPPTMRPPAQLK